MVYVLDLGLSGIIINTSVSGIIPSYYINFTIFFEIIIFFPVKLQGSFRSTVIYCLVTSETGLERRILKSFQRIGGKILPSRFFGNYFEYFGFFLG